MPSDPVLLEDSAGLKANLGAALYYVLASKPASIGSLIDYADAVAPEQVIAVATAVGLSVLGDYKNGQRRASRRRRLIMLGALLTRLAFEIEGIPKDRSDKI